jgi:aminomethyltransferase
MWETIQRRTFPGSVSNHHLGTLFGLLMSAYEMNAFKEEYQKAVIANARKFASALKNTGLTVAGDPEIGHTETHQVIVEVGYGKGVETARRLEESNIIVNFQASPYEEGFTASGALRMGVAEMTRYGMEADDFETAAQLIHDVVMESKNVGQEVIRFRRKFINMKYCFTDHELEHCIEQLHSLI